MTKLLPLNVGLKKRIGPQREGKKPTLAAFIYDKAQSRNKYTCTEN